VPDFLTSTEERDLVDVIAQMPLKSVKMRGQTLRRQMLEFGVEFGANFRSLHPAQPIPDEFERFIIRGRSALGCESRFDQAIVQVYPRGASIGWHRDAKELGPVVFGLSLVGSGVLLLRDKDARHTVRVELPQRSVYLLSGAVRNDWSHCATAVKMERVSITFRSTSLCVAPCGSSTSPRP
jgi:alkylated DNA repair protein (DNA oxidative demethylase)